MDHKLIYDSRDIRCKKPYGAVPSGTAVQFTLRPPHEAGFTRAQLTASFEAWHETVVIREMPSVSGEKGLAAFRTLVEVWMKNGGTALNVNIVSPETLRDAQAHPEKYENLQVRVAGWNVRWIDIPRKEQDEYIARIEAVGAE